MTTQGTVSFGTGPSLLARLLRVEQGCIREADTLLLCSLWRGPGRCGAALACWTLTGPVSVSVGCSDTSFPQLCSSLHSLLARVYCATVTGSLGVAAGSSAWASGQAAASRESCAACSSAGPADATDCSLIYVLDERVDIAGKGW